MCRKIASSGGVAGGLMRLFYWTQNPTSILINYLLGSEYTIIDEGGARITGERGKGIISLYINAKKRGVIFRPHDEDEVFLAEENESLFVCRDLSAFHPDLYRYVELFFDRDVENVLDVGGYMGASMARFKNADAQKVLVYEPVPENVERIHETVRINGFNGVEVFEKAVGDVSGETTIKSKAPRNRGSFGKERGDHHLRVEMETWDEVLDKGVKARVDLIKIDAEGAEAHLLEADEDTIRKFPFWIIECHGKQIKRNLKAMFEDYDFKTQIEGEHMMGEGELSLLVVSAGKDFYA